MAARNRNWSDIPIELFALILQKLTMPDHIRLSCVCARWFMAIMTQGIQAPRPQAPWLMLPEEGGDNDDDDIDEDAAKFYSLSERRFYKVRLPLPPIASRVCVGSAHGWLITVTDFVIVHLLNPLTCVQIQLPSLSTLPGYDPIWALHHRVFVRKAILSSPPSPDGGGDFAVIIIYRPGRLAFVRVGDTAWKAVASSRHTSDIVDMIHHKGKLYTITAAYFDGVSTWDEGLLFCPMLQPSQIQAKQPTFVASTRICRSYHQKYLVESLRGELFMVARNNNAGITLDFKVVRLDVERKEWHEVPDLEENILFVGTNYSMAISAMEFTELSRNCIYFTDDVEEMAFHKNDRMHLTDRVLRILSERKGWPDVGTFSMKEKKIQRTDYLGLRLSWPPVWVTPAVLRNAKPDELGLSYGGTYGSVFRPQEMATPHKKQLK